MAKIDKTALTDWNNGDTVKEDGLEKDFEVLRVALNATDDEVKSNKTHSDGVASRVSTLESKYGSGVASAIQEYTWTPTEGQTVFTLPSGQTYAAGYIDVIVGGVLQTDVIESSGTTFTLAEGVPAGVTEVYAKWFQGVALASSLVPSITDMPGYSTNVDDRIGSLSKITYLINDSMSQTDINNALQTYDSVKFLKGTYTVDPVIGILPKSNQNIEFEKGVVIQASATDADNYQILELRGVENVVISGGEIIGERYTHLTTTGQGGHGVFITESKNITISNLISKDCWGDGFYIGSGTFANDNIHFINCTAENNRRNGLSITNGSNLTFDNCDFNNSNGQTPEFGVDIEPNYATETLDKIVFNNCKTKNNASGIGFGNARINQNTSVNITFNNCTCDGDSFQAKDCWGNGVITFNACKSFNSVRVGFALENTFIKIQAISPYVFNPNQNSSTSSNYGAGINIINTETVNPNIGNISITDAEIISTDMKMTKAVSIAGLAGWAAKIVDTFVSFRTNVDVAKRLFFGNATLGSGNKVIMLDHNKAYFHRMTNANITPVMLEDYHFMTVTNKGTTTSIAVDLDTNSKIEIDGTEFTFEVWENFRFIIRGNTRLIYPKAVSSTECKTKGGKLKLRWSSNLQGWEVIEKVGKWLNIDENTGSLTYSGNGSATTKTIAHGMNVTPTIFSVTPASVDAGNAGIKFVTADATNLTVTFNTAPISGTNNVSLTWKAEI